MTPTDADPEEPRGDRTYDLAWTESIDPKSLVRFFPSIPARLPTGESDAVRERVAIIGRELLVINARTLGRAPDLRVPPDIEDLASQLAARLGLFTSADWDRHVEGVPLLEHVRLAVGRMSAELRGNEHRHHPDDDWDS